MCVKSTLSVFNAGVTVFHNGHTSLGGCYNAKVLGHFNVTGYMHDGALMIRGCTSLVGCFNSGVPSILKLTPW